MKKLLVLIGLIIVGFAVKFFVSSSNNSSTNQTSQNDSQLEQRIAPVNADDELAETAIQAATNQNHQQLREKEVLAKKTREMTAVEALIIEGSALSGRILNTEQDEKKRLLNASATGFFAFYLANTKTRKEFCQTQGVDISLFISAFEQEHADLLAKSRLILSTTKTADYNAPLDEARIYGEQVHNFRAAIDNDMTDLAKQKNISIKAVCETFSQNGESIASEMQISKLQPNLFQVLSSL